MKKVCFNIFSNTDCPLIWISALLVAIVIIIAKVNGENQVVDDYVNKFGRNSDYSKRAWKIKHAGRIVEEGESENCFASSPATTGAGGPLCEICLRAVNQTFSTEERARLQNAAFLRGTLTFPNADYDDMPIDVIMCTYNPVIGVARFYVTRGKEKNSAYIVNNSPVGSDKYRFTLHGKYIKWN